LHTTNSFVFYGALIHKGKNAFHNSTVLEALSCKLPDEASPILGVHPVISYGILLLQRIANNPPPLPREDFASPQDWAGVYAVIDLLVLEAIYPSLCPGVGIPLERRVKSTVLKSKRLGRSQKNVVQLEQAVSALLNIFRPGSKI